MEIGTTPLVVRGTISSTQLAGDHRIVVGRWPTSPIGPLVDVMWRAPDGERRLLVDSEEGAALITSIYEFDDVRIGPLRVEGDDRHTRVRTDGLELDVTGGRRRPVPVRRPLAFTCLVEAPIARALMGVEVHGLSPRGALEWYQTTGWRWIDHGRAAIDGVDVGAPRPFTGPVGVGFSEPPARPSIVSVRVTIVRPGP
ncbi:MAG: hypothetical protein ACFCVK_12330 [Acidimicrobiales bacterium]